MNIKLNLLNLISAVRYEDGASGPVECLIIPIDRNYLFRGQSGVYLDMTAWEMKEPRGNDSHLIKQSLPKEVYERMTDEERRSMPILGNVSTFKSESKAVSSSEPLPPNTKLPF